MKIKIKVIFSSPRCNALQTFSTFISFEFNGWNNGEKHTGEEYK